MFITAAVTREKGQRFIIEDVELDGPRPNEILVRMVAVGICHSDILASEQVMPVTFPVVLGHEGAGIVEAVGADVTKVGVGDRVVLTFNSCGTCISCRNGAPANCLNFMTLNYSGSRPDGSHALCSCGTAISCNFFGQSSFASYALGTERNVVKVDGDTPLEILAPLGCGIQTGAGTVMVALAARRGSSIVVFGGGPVGLSAIMGAVVQECGTIVLVEPVEARRTLALELGATHVIDPKSTDVTARIAEIAPLGMDYAVDSSGAVQAVEMALACLAMRGTLALVGVPSNPAASLPVGIIDMLMRGLTIKGVVEGDSIPHDFIPHLVRLQAEGRFPLEKLIKTFPFSDINFAVAEQKAGNCVKVVLTF